MLLDTHFGRVLGVGYNPCTIFGRDIRYSGAWKVDLGNWRWLTEKSRRE